MADLRGCYSAIAPAKSGQPWALFSVYGPSGAWSGGVALRDAELTFSHVNTHIAHLVAAGVRCVVMGDMNLVVRRANLRGEPGLQGGGCWRRPLGSA